MFNSNNSSVAILNKPFFVFLIGLILTLIVWFIFGYGPEFFVGTNDISHHLLTLRISNNAFPHFTPIYDWLWMGGQLVAPNVGHVPLERFFLSLGLNEGFSLSLTVFIFHATIFSFSYDLFSQKLQFSLLENLLLSIALSFLPSTVTRIFFGHTSLYFPIAFLFFLLWILNTNRFSWFLFGLGVLFGLITLSGPSFQLVFYFVFFVFPLIYFFNQNQLKERWYLFLLAILIPSFLSLDFLVLIYNYLFSGNDLFRKTDDTLLLYSYAKLNYKHILDFFTFKIVNLNNDDYFLFHETKYFLGLSTLLFIFKKQSSRQNIFLFSFLLVIMLFIIPPFNFLSNAFSMTPGLNLFRIPQRVFLLLSPLLIFYSYYFYKPIHFKEKLITWLILLLLILLSYWHDLLWLDLSLVAFSFLILFSKSLLFSFRQYLFFQVCALFLYSFQYDGRVTPDNLINLDKNIKASMKRSQTLNSLGWHMNTNRVYNINSVFGYTHPHPAFRGLYQHITGQHVVDQLFFSPSRFLNGFLSLYRYEKQTLSYSPALVSENKSLFLSSVKKSDFNPEKFAFTNTPNVRACPLPVKITSEEIINGTLIVGLENPNQFKCLVVVPFNFSNFLIAYSDHSPIKLFPVNVSQFGFLAPLNKSVISIGPNYSFYWKVKWFGFLIGSVFLLLFYYFRRRINF